MESFDKLLELLENKKKQTLTEEEQKKVDFLSTLFKDKACFFKLDADTSFGILEFLGVPKEEIKTTYFSLISMESFQKVTPMVRYTTSNK